MGAHNAPHKLHSSSVEKPDPGSAGTITVDRSPCYVGLVSAGAEARTLAAPTRLGASVTIAAKTAVGTITLTVTGGYNEAGDTTFSLTAAGQHAEFVSVEDGSDLRWRLRSSYVVSNNAAFSVTGTAAGVKIASGITALDGSNPTNIATGLTTVTGFSAIVNSTDASTGTAFLTYGTIAAGTVPVYAADDTGTASAGTENVAWVAVGT